jgi:hypothetical protein
LNSSLITATTEIMRFNQGDYIDWQSTLVKTKKTLQISAGFFYVNLAFDI